MNRFLSLLALVAVPAAALAADAAAQPAATKKCMCMAGPCSAQEDTWLARTDVSVNFAQLPKHLRKSSRHYTMYGLNTIQPIYRSDDMHNTVYGFAGIGSANWKKDQWDLGVGFRHIVPSGAHMFGVGVLYNHGDIRHVRAHGTGAYLEWLTQYTTVTLGQTWNKLHVTEHAWKHYLHHSHDWDVTGLDISFQLPYLPWTQLTLGKTWDEGKVGRKSFHHYRSASLRRIDCGLRLNLIGCLAVEGGFQNSGTYARIVLSFGRPASNEFTLADGFFGSEAFTARDLTTQTLKSASRTRVN
jgi:hypothetical protein